MKMKKVHDITKKVDGYFSVSRGNKLIAIGCDGDINRDAKTKEEIFNMEVVECRKVEGLIGDVTVIKVK